MKKKVGETLQQSARTPGGQARIRRYVSFVASTTVAADARLAAGRLEPMSYITACDDVRSAWSVEFVYAVLR